MLITITLGLLLGVCTGVALFDHTWKDWTDE